MKRASFALVTLAVALPLAVVACEEERKPLDSPPPTASSVGVSATAPLSASAPKPLPSASVAAPASSKDPETDEPDDTDEESATSDITIENYEKEMDSLEKLVGTKY